MSTGPAVRRLTSPPPGFDAAVAEMGEGLGALYGPAAEREYALSAPLHFRSALGHPSVYAYGTFLDGELTGFAVILFRSGVARLVLGHIRRPWHGTGQERALVAGALEGVRGAGALRLLAEFVPFGPFDDGVFRDLGLRRAERAVMLADTAVVADHAPSFDATEPFRSEDVGAMARVLTDAYADHPGRWLHPEAAAEEAAREFIEAAASGAYGEAPAGVIRVAREGGRVVGICIGAKAAAGAGFVLHAAVVPDRQGRGLGAALVGAVAAAFAGEGYGRIGLGVTVGNPAERLYRRLGFETVRTIGAYAGWIGVDGTWSPVPRDVP